MALFSTVAALAKYIPSIISVGEDEFSSMFEEEINKAEQYLELNLLGGVYAEIENDDKLTALSKYIVAYYAAVRFIPQLDLLLTESGFVVTSNSNQSPASKERVERLIATYTNKTDDSIEDLFLYLEAKDDYYTAWQTAKIYTRFDDMPCATNKVFTQYAIGWDNRYSIDFYQLRAKMVEVRDQFIKPKIGAAFYDYILAHPEEEKILPFIHNYRMAFASAVLNKKRAADNIMNSVWSYIIENRTEYPEFDTYYESGGTWENSTDDNIVVFGL